MLQRVRAVGDIAVRARAFNAVLLPTYRRIDNVISHYSWLYPHIVKYTTENLFRLARYSNVSCLIKNIMSLCL